MDEEYQPATEFYLYFVLFRWAKRKRAKFMGNDKKKNLKENIRWWLCGLTPRFSTPRGAQGRKLSLTSLNVFNTFNCFQRFFCFVCGLVDFETKEESGKRKSFIKNVFEVYSITNIELYFFWAILTEVAPYSIWKIGKKSLIFGRKMFHW